MESKKCENCGMEIDGSFGSGRFCNLKCANSYNGKKCQELRKQNNFYKSERWIKSCSDRQKKVWENEEFRKILCNGQKNRDPKTLARGESLSKAVGNSTKNKYKGKEFTSLLELSKRTVSKILRRLKIGCSRCGWNECVCDIHHINGRKIEDANGHWNLTYLCPNCHRMAHREKIDKSSFVTLAEQLPENWHDYYYG